MNPAKHSKSGELSRKHAYMNQLMNISTNPLAWFDNATVFASTDIYRQRGKLHIDIELPQFSENEIKLEQEGNEIRVFAEHTETEDDKKSYLFRESSESLFRSIQIPSDANSDKVKVNFRNGVLEIKMPLLKQHAAKTLPIES